LTCVDIPSLADIGPEFGTAIAAGFVFPFNQNFVDRAVRGDYFNITANLDLTIPRLKRGTTLNCRSPGRQCPRFELEAWCPPRDLPHTDRMPQVPSARYLLRAKDLVDARYGEPITVNDMAAAAGLSRAHFSRMFARTFGESPHSYLQSRRLERAAALLRYTDRSVADICVMVGLLGVGSFTSSFARAYGLPPAAYRASVPPASVHARVPSCVLRRDTRPVPEGRANTAHGEKTGDARPP
jgi:AraC-like DNA-binding protein